MASPTRDAGIPSYQRHVEDWLQAMFNAFDAVPICTPAIE